MGFFKVLTKQEAKSMEFSRVIDRDGHLVARVGAISEA
jgi:hypothetical protein